MSGKKTCVCVYVCFPQSRKEHLLLCPCMGMSHRILSKDNDGMEKRQTQVNRKAVTGSSKLSEGEAEVPIRQICCIGS